VSDLQVDRFLFLSSFPPSALKTQLAFFLIACIFKLLVGCSKIIGLIKWFSITGLGSILPRRCQWMCFSKSFTSKNWSLHSVHTLHHNHILILRKIVMLENWRLWPSLLYVSLTDLWQRAENMWLKVFHFRSLIDESKEKYVCLIVEVSVAWILSPFVFQFSGMVSP
jgi:hypothetical protein